MKHIYLFSGLGADQRAFQNIDFSGYQTHFMEWMPPISDETMESYAQHLIPQIKEPDPVLIGVSFGGMMAVEVAKLIKTQKLIIISSAKIKSEIPFYYKLTGVSKLNRVINANLFSKMNGVNYWMFGVKEKDEKKLLNDIIRDTDPGFLNWATDKIVNWKNQTLHNNLVHLHGTADKILPFRFVKDVIAVPGGEHFMIVSKGKEISALIRKELAR